MGERGRVAGATAAVEDDAGPMTGLSRRTIIAGALGAAAAGAVSGSILTMVGAEPADAATTVEPGAVAPGVVTLVDAPTISLDAGLGNDFRVTIHGNRTMANPANPTDGQQILLQVTQGAPGSFSVSWGSAYGFSDQLPAPTLSTAPGRTDLLGFLYDAALQSWLLVGVVEGFH